MQIHIFETNNTEKRLSLLIGFLVICIKIYLEHACLRRDKGYNQKISRFATDFHSKALSQKQKVGGGGGKVYIF